MLRCSWSWCVYLLTYCGHLSIVFSVFSKTACIPHDMDRSIFLNAFKNPRQRVSWEIITFFVFNHLFMPAVHIKYLKLQVFCISNPSYVLANVRRLQGDNTRKDFILACRNSFVFISPWRWWTFTETCWRDYLNR